MLELKPRTLCILGKHNQLHCNSLHLFVSKPPLPLPVLYVSTLGSYDKIAILFCLHAEHLVPLLALAWPRVGSVRPLMSSSVPRALGLIFLPLCFWSSPMLLQECAADWLLKSRFRQANVHAHWRAFWSHIWDNIRERGGRLNERASLVVVNFLGKRKFLELQWSSQVVLKTKSLGFRFPIDSSRPCHDFGQATSSFLKKEAICRPCANIPRKLVRVKKLPAQRGESCTSQHLLGS